MSKYYKVVQDFYGDTVKAQIEAVEAATHPEDSFERKASSDRYIEHFANRDKAEKVVEACRYIENIPVV